MGAEGAPDAEGDLARLMLRYLTQHPTAKDTADGIATWWLRQQRIEQSVEAVHRALDLLVGRGLVLERQGPDRRRYYEINAGRMDEIAAFLRDHRRAD